MQLVNAKQIDDTTGKKNAKQISLARAKQIKAHCH
jgi:hypothetical protein